MQLFILLVLIFTCNSVIYSQKILDEYDTQILLDMTSFKSTTLQYEALTECQTARLVIQSIKDTMIVSLPNPTHSAKFEQTEHYWAVLSNKTSSNNNQHRWVTLMVGNDSTHSDEITLMDTEGFSDFSLFDDETLILIDQDHNLLKRYDFAGNCLKTIPLHFNPLKITTRNQNIYCFENQAINVVNGRGISDHNLNFDEPWQDYYFESDTLVVAFENEINFYDPNFNFFHQIPLEDSPLILDFIVKDEKIYYLHFDQGYRYVTELTYDGKQKDIYKSQTDNLYYNNIKIINDSLYLIGHQEIKNSKQISYKNGAYFNIERPVNVSYDIAINITDVIEKIDTVRKKILPNGIIDYQLIYNYHLSYEVFNHSNQTIHSFMILPNQIKNNCGSDRITFRSNNLNLKVGSKKSYYRQISSEEKLEDICLYTVSINGESDVNENNNDCYRVLTSNYTIKPSQTVIYPNPVRNQLTIESDENIQEIIIFNMQGVKVLHQKHIAGQGINTEHLPTGVYWLGMQTQKQALQFLKFIKQ